MNLKKKLLKRCVLMGVFFGIFFSAMMTLTAPDGIHPLLYFAILAVFAGPLYGFLMYPVLRYQQKAMLRRFPALEAKLVIAEQAAFRVSTEKPKAVSGWAYLTDDALYFSAEAKKYGDLSAELLFDQITDLQIDTVRRSECVKLNLADGSTICLRFGNVSTDWAININKAIQAYNDKLRSNSKNVPEATT